MKLMRAAFAEAIGEPLKLREVPIPEPGPGEVLVRIAASGVCHTDVSILDGEWPMKKPRFPVVLGHEATGYVAGLGEGVRTHKEGDRVGVFWLNSACGTCEDCTTDHEPQCVRQVGTGYNVNGTYADYCVVSESFAVPLPDGPSLEELAPILCAGVTSYKALKTLGARPDSWVVVSGVGGAGHLAIQYATALGLKVAAIDVSAEKAALAESLGASFTVNAEKEFPVNRIVHRTGGGAHGVVVTTGAAKAMEQGARMLRRAGTLMVVGVAPEPLPLSVFDLVIKGLSVRGTLIGTRQDVREALALVAAGKVRPLVESRTLDDVNGAITALRQRQVQGRLVLRMT
ncbi:alcohol dehydrogenase, propanol-preferring [Myxococcus fulvus]|uniref:alcohol dehydrogenase n=1 Tax=Myxococcus fulvus TaxID=33 RepID=A0A511TDJ9_MYXFU|nr:zinc-dependent alcohol dehydrogenase [Myxococcus fulvus]GEN12234.1 zinc-dependent alcohol dehydrogenase [Myxococcus fulvus]SEU27136.1 alcohol dehydrogenase, propanol-preferring [Myxococcus fulvus]